MTSRRDFIRASRGIKKVDCLLRGGQVVDVFSGEIYPETVAIYAGKIVGFGDYPAGEEIDLEGKYLAPGFIDSHLHLESSLLTPGEFARAAVPHGTVAVITDPHEIANVMGEKGILRLMALSNNLPLDVFLMLPSGVPSTKLETSGAALTAHKLAPFLKEKMVLGLAEVMDYTGVLKGENSVLQKIALAENLRVDGHAPTLSGRDLSAYAGAGITSDHESVTLAEAKEKLRRGMRVFIRQGSAAKNLADLLPLVTPYNSRFCHLVSDDIEPRDLIVGHLDAILKDAVARGLDPVTAISMVTINPAEYYRLKDYGAVAPGYWADLVILEDIQDFRVAAVFKRGKIVAREGRVSVPLKEAARVREDTVNFKPFSLSALAVPAKSSRIKVIELVKDQITTRARITGARVEKGEVVADPDRDILKLVVVERHRRSGRIGHGFVSGTGLKKGALASTYAHDAHNIVGVGENDQDLYKAIGELKKMRGGMVIVADGQVKAALPLPLAGLMSDQSLAFVQRRLGDIHRAAEGLGVTLEHPFHDLSFVSLPVIPELRLTDKGLLDVTRMKIVELFA